MNIQHNKSPPPYQHNSCNKEATYVDCGHNALRQCCNAQLPRAQTEQLNATVITYHTKPSPEKFLLGGKYVYYEIVPQNKILEQPHVFYRVTFLTGPALNVLSVGDGKIPTKKVKV